MYATMGTDQQLQQRISEKLGIAVMGIIRYLHYLKTWFSGSSVSHAFHRFTSKGSLFPWPICSDASGETLLHCHLTATCAGTAMQIRLHRLVLLGDEHIQHVD